MYLPFGSQKINFTFSDRSCQHMLSYSVTPVQEIHDPLFDQASVRLLIKREDLNNPFVSGNKWWKLKYNLQEAKQSGHNTLLTFGGAYSNHIYAAAAAAHASGLQSIGVIRGEEALPLNNTLAFAASKGMALHYVSREAYRSKTEKDFIDNLHETFGDFYLIPEGGTNDFAVKGVTEFAQSLGNDFDYICCAVGTGGTIAGLINGISSAKKIIGFPVLKNGQFLTEEIKALLPREANNWLLSTDYHFGGYAKVNPELTSFVERFKTKHQIQLDLIYTGKAMSGIYDMIAKHSFSAGSTILFIHTGGVR
jgi:1-aminocyclopropane-1-carboxylate deaminase